MPQQVRPLFQPQQGAVVGQTTVITPDASSLLWAGVAEALAAAEATPIVAGDGYTMSVTLWRATVDNSLVEDISGQLVDGMIDMNLDRAVKLAATFTIRDPSNIRPYTDFLAPFIRLTYDDGGAAVYQQVGLFATKVAPGSYSVNDAVATFEGMDLTSVMASSYLTDASNEAAATNYATAIIGCITGAGITRHNIPATSSTLPLAQTFPIGMSRLEKANLLCDQLGWYHLGMDLDGRISTPGAPQNLASMEPWRTLTGADIMGAIDVQPTGQEIANVVLVVNDDAASAPLSSTATNSDPQSPTSTVAIGRSLMRKEVVTGSTTQASIDALAARLLAESRTYYRTSRVTILHDPTALALHQIVTLNLTGEQEALSGRWWVRTASLGLTADKPVVLELNQVTSDLTAAVI